VADTKHHRIDVLGIDGSAPHPLAIRGLSVPSVGVALDVARPNTEGEPHISLGEVPLAATGSSTVHFDWKTPAGTGINEEAPFRLDWTSSDGLASVPSPIKSTGATVQHGFDLSLTPIAGAAAGKLTGELSVVLCDVTTHLVCVPVRRSIELGFRAASVKGESPTVLIPLPEAKP
jgi:energy-converting hydrogenase Eha subunit A